MGRHNGSYEHCIIYGLIDPRDNTLRYIGKTVRSLALRLRCHLRDKYHCRRTNWIKSLAKVGLAPTIMELETVPREDGDDAEVSMIAFARSCGAFLVNGTDGGDGMSNITPEIRRKMSESRRRQPINWNAIAAMQAARVPPSPKTRQKMSEARRAYMAVPEKKAAIIKALTGHTVSAESRAKISAKIKGRKHTPEVIAKIAYANRNRSQATLIKRRATWANKRTLRTGQPYLFDLW